MGDQRFRPRAAGVDVPRTGETVAASLRGMILNGQLNDGDHLPPQAELLAHFGVSHPSLREGLRILEAEGLITVRRGKLGGAVVRVPSTTGIAYSLGLALQAAHADLADLARALDHLEPLCFGLVAARPDRADVIPRLVAECDRLAASIESADFSAVARDFHVAAAESCGNASLRLTVGALTRLWSSHEISVVAGSSTEPVAEKSRLAVLRAHRKLTSLIERGDAAGVRRLAAAHLDRTHEFIGGRLAAPVDVATLPLSWRQSG